LRREGEPSASGTVVSALLDALAAMGRLWPPA
jgi:hypothetical protein